jgi:hypothetical protein
MRKLIRCIKDELFREASEDPFGNGDVFKIVLVTAIISSILIIALLIKGLIFLIQQL